LQDEIARWPRRGRGAELLNDDALFAACAADLAAGRAVAWCQGRAELAARTGNRSILADARSPRTHRR
jgi:predicted NodU family carbamoyl transferase